MKRQKFYILSGFFIILGFGLAASVGASLAKDSKEGRYQAPNNLFSISLPKGWSSRDWPGMKFPIFFTEAAHSFAPNINIVDENSHLPLKEYVAANQKTLKRVMTDYRELSLKPFVTDKNLNGFRLVFINNYKGSKLKQIQYYFSLPSTKLVITCSMAEQDTRPIPAQCDESLKSFEIPEK